MSQIPLRSVRLNARPATYYQTFVGTAGEIFYDSTNQTLRIYQGNTLGGKILADRDWVNSAGVINYNNLTNKPVLFSGSYNDLTNKPSLFSGSYDDLTNKPSLADTYQFSIAADDSTQRVISTDEVVKFIGAGRVTTSSDAEGNITITGAESDRLSVTGATVVFAKDQYNTSRLTFTGGATIETAGYLSSVGGLGIFDSSVQQSVVVKSDRVQINTGFPDQGTGGVDSFNEWRFLKSGVFKLPTAGIIENNNKQWTFGTTGTLTIPGDIRSEGNINIEVNLTDSTKYIWQFGEDGQLTFPDGGNLRVSAVPATSIGSAGDTAGMLAFNASYAYYCTANYDGVTNIWRRTAHDVATW